MNDLTSLVDEKTLTRPALDVGPFVDRLRSRYGEKLLGIFMYGSLLSSVTASDTSFPDFFVITEGYDGVFDKLSQRISAYPLPPHLFHLRLDEKRHCKYNLVSLRRFQQETSRYAMDIYIVGRFGKRVSLLYYKDQPSKRTLLDCCRNAMQSVSLWTLRGMSGRFSTHDFILACLNISYIGETRVESESKVAKLFAAEEEYYTQVYSHCLTHLVESLPFLIQVDSDTFELRQTELRKFFNNQAQALFLLNSRLRGIARWPKFLLTVEEWIDIILAKIERTKGIKLQPSDLERKYPLILGWPYLYRLIRMGAFGSRTQQPDQET